MNKTTLSARFVIFAAVIVGLAMPRFAVAQTAKTVKGLLALYTFEKEGNGKQVYDKSDNSPALDLNLKSMDHLTQLTPRGLQFHRGGWATSPRAAKKINKRIRIKGEFSLEVWLATDNVRQPDPGQTPARIVTLSDRKDGLGQRNLTLGQMQDKFDLRIRVGGKTNGKQPLEGSKDLRVKAEAKKLTHLVFTFDAGGTIRFYRDGQLVQSYQAASSDLGQWKDEFFLTLGNENPHRDRPWVGCLYQVAIFNRAITAHDVDALSKDNPKPKKKVAAKTGSAILHVSVPNGAMVFINDKRTFNRSWQRDRHFRINGLDYNKATEVKVKVALREDNCHCDYKDDKCNCGYKLKSCCKTVYLRARDEELLTFAKKAIVLPKK